MIVTRMMVGDGGDDRSCEQCLCSSQNCGSSESPILKILHQQKDLNLQGEKTALATIAHFQVCLRTRQHTGDWDPLAGALQSSEVLP